MAVPCNQPTLHLTLGLYDVTGLDLLQWVVGKLGEREIFRRTIPHQYSADRLSEYFTEIQRNVTDCMADAGLIEAFLRQRSLARSAVAGAVEQFGLPWSVTSFDRSHCRNCRIRFNGEVRRPDDANCNIVVYLGARSFTFDPESEPIFDFLMKDQVLVRELYRELADQFESDTIDTLLEDLVMHGIVLLEGET